MFAKVETHSAPDKTTLTRAYFFEQGAADGSSAMSGLLGGKGANLSEMCNMGIAVPPGFILTTELCREYYINDRQLPEGFTQELRGMMAKLESVTNKEFGSATNPLLVSVRSGAKQSMPGMMDTILNLGINSLSLKGLLNQYDERFVYDSYRRLIHMYAVVVFDINDFCFEEALSELKIACGARNDGDLTADNLKCLVTAYKAIVMRESEYEFPDDPFTQLIGAIKAVFNSWNSERAIKYRAIHKLNTDGGTAINIQSMVFGNIGDTSASGVLFSRNPVDGADEIFGEYLLCSQGEDIVAGIRTPYYLYDDRPTSLSRTIPDVAQKLRIIAKQLERHYRDMQDIEFTIEEGKLWILQTRRGKRSVAASIRIAVEMCNEGLITKEEALMRIKPDELKCLFHPALDSQYCTSPALIGLAASPGSASGKVVFDSLDSEGASANGEKVILFRIETSPEDIAGMHAAQATVTARGGMTSHAAVVARGMGKPCICGALDLIINYQSQTAIVKCGGKVQEIHKNDVVTINGSTGELFIGEIPLIQPVLNDDFYVLMQWCDEKRKLGVRANADNERDCDVALKFGADGVGLCRTEHMFFEERRLSVIRALIVTNDKEVREGALAKLLEIQCEAFKEIFFKMKGLPVTIRLLDPPLHEFISKDPIVIQNTCKAAKLTESEAMVAVHALSEVNPMLGARGVRLGIIMPDIYHTQVKAIFMAAREIMVKDGIASKPEIMIPFIFCAKEMEVMRNMIDRIAVENSVPRDAYKVGSMIELPSAAINADTIAPFCGFLSFGTNDLTQTTLGISRDDSAKFIGTYIESGILESDPFLTLDQEGVGALMRIAVQKARSVNPEMSIGICGEHGACVQSVRFCSEIGLDYTSCSPYSLPTVKLVAAQVAIGDK